MFEKGKNIAIVVIIVLLVASLGFSAFGVLSRPAPGSPLSQTPPKTVVVTGQGEIIAIPDMAVVTLGITSENKVLSVAYKANNTKMNELTAGLIKLGVKKVDIQTSNFTVYPNYNYTGGKNVLLGYQVTNNVTIKIRNIENAGKILESAIVAKANNVYGLEFRLSDSTKEYKLALDAAIKNAEDKAKSMTGYFNLKIKKPISIKEISIGNPTPIMVNKVMESADQSANVNPGSATVSANVEVEFEY